MEDIYTLEIQINEYLRDDFVNFDAQKIDFISHISKAVTVYDEKNFAANFALGVISRINFDEQNAATHFDKCLSHPENIMVAAAHLNLAAIFYEKKDYESANTNFSTALLYRKFQLEEQIEDLSSKIKNDWIPEEINGLKLIILDDDVKKNIQKSLRYDFDIANNEMFDIKNLELRMHDLEKKKNYRVACVEFHEYWMKHGQD